MSTSISAIARTWHGRAVGATHALAALTVGAPFLVAWTSILTRMVARTARTTSASVARLAGKLNSRKRRWSSSERRTK